MKISVWRAQLKTWLQKYLTVTAWEFDYPKTPAETLAMLPPLKDVNIYKNGASVMGSATQVIELISRVDGTIKYNDLPLQLYEGVYTTLSYRLLTEFADIADIYQLQMQATDPVHVAERTDARGDWFIRVQWTFNIQWVAEVETGSTGAPYDLNRIVASINRALVPKTPEDVVDGTRYTEDIVITITDNI